MNWVTELRRAIENRPRGKTIPSVLLTLKQDIPDIEQLIASNSPDSTVPRNQQIYDILYPEKIKRYTEGNRVTFEQFLSIRA